MISIIDYGMGNPGSIMNMFKRIGVESQMTADAELIRTADALVLPGVGHFDNGMRHLADQGLIDAMNESVLERKCPILGICLGMQLFSRSSEEGQLPGLGWIAADTRKFRKEEMSDPKLRIPHMGWNRVVPTTSADLFPQTDDLRFYHVHSYHLVLDHEDDALTHTFYGYDFVSGVERDNILGVQFHPEKSHKFGMDFMRGFARRFSLQVNREE